MVCECCGRSGHREDAKVCDMCGTPLLIPQVRIGVELHAIIGRTNDGGWLMFTTPRPDHSDVWRQLQKLTRTGELVPNKDCQQYYLAQLQFRAVQPSTSEPLYRFEIVGIRHVRWFNGILTWSIRGIADVPDSLLTIDCGRIITAAA